MHIHLGNILWFEIGKYGTLALLTIASWLSRQRWLPVIDDPVTCPRCGDMRGQPAAWAVTGYETDHCTTCYRALRDGQPAEVEWVTCPRCGREDVAAHTMRGGQCARCNLWERTAYGRGDGFHYARVRSTDAVERHYDGQPCECPNAPGYSGEAEYSRMLSTAFRAGYQGPGEEEDEEEEEG